MQSVTFHSPRMIQFTSLMYNELLKEGCNPIEKSHVRFFRREGFNETHNAITFHSSESSCTYTF